MDFILTVCDSAAGEACPVWPGHPSIAHWGIEDPTTIEGSEVDRAKAFVRAFQFLKNRNQHVRPPATCRSGSVYDWHPA